MRRSHILAASIFLSASASTATAAFVEVPTDCDADAATAVAKTSDYTACQTASGFTFDVSLGTSTNEDKFCTTVSCLKVFRDLRSRTALQCAVVSGLGAVPLTKGKGQTDCFGKNAVENGSNVIVRPGASTSGSGSAGSGPGTTSPPPTTKTPTPTTPEPTTLSPEPTMKPTTTTTKPTNNSSSSSSSGSKSTQIPQKTTKAPSPNTSNEDADTNSGMDTAAIVSIIGVTVGVLAVLASLTYAGSKNRRKNRPRRSKHQQRPTHGEYDEEEMPPHGMMASAQTAYRPSQQQYIGMGGTGNGTTMTQGFQSGTSGFGSAFAGWDEELIAAVRVPYEKLTFDQLISRGGYGEVYRGTYRGQVVAIKTLLPERRRDMKQIQSFLAEVKIMASMDHERIVRLLGVAWDSLEELSVVTEYLERGDLRSVLCEFEAKRTRPHGFDLDKIKIALHVAHALTYLHSMQPAVLHRDLKSRNILLDAKLNAKLADFGVSRERADATMTAGVGSSLWMAPEVMVGERYDEKADVFSFGVVLSELDSHLLPYTHAVEPVTGRKLPDAVILQMVSLGRIHAKFTDEDKSEMAKIGLQCVSLNPDDRPTAAQALHRIHQVWRQWS